ncbi:glutathione peroxidase [Salinicoccus hispanicus]|uniref:Glutathione peroxidase n=1 Tax=Salinicoccus hispanicus TaxID=157225 RepID=A0A6N8U0R8_9STAP|nr:glutathione peroxidase [Salinicoccus hispanicus]MXQ49925.1 redoxin domain-containing protein [Salinicoccus hispanicus]
MKTHIYDFTVHDDAGIPMQMKDFEGKVILIVNSASDCALCNQLSELEFLFQKYKDEGFVVLVFPSDDFMNSEPLDASEAKIHYYREYGVTFPVMEKVHVKGDSIHSLFRHLTESKTGLLTSSVKWNFTKFLISREGRIVKRLPPRKSPLTFEDDLIRVLRG